MDIRYGLREDHNTIHYSKVNESIYDEESTDLDDEI